MNQTEYIISIFLLLFCIIIFTRALPFMFGRFLKNNQTIPIIGKHLPSYIMMLLVLYELNISTFTKPPYGIPQLVALAMVTALHLWKRNVLLSLIGGILVYISLLYVI